MEQNQNAEPKPIPRTLAVEFTFDNLPIRKQFEQIVMEAVGNSGLATFQEGKNPSAHGKDVKMYSKFLVTPENAAALEKIIASALAVLEIKAETKLVAPPERKDEPINQK